MKQYVEISQLNELSEKGKENLLRWCKSKCDSGDEAHNYWDMGNVHLETKDKPVCLSVGQMIEFLNDANFLELQYHLGENNKWRVNWNKDKRIDKFSQELCDALFEVVKELLDNE